ncbi:unnamed protein product [Pedinophyceae sp. YPF-701]|nr:unnamed protein product [Pedinophyceae sp. YPF-701]
MTEQQPAKQEAAPAGRSLARVLVVLERSMVMAQALPLMLERPLFQKLEVAMDSDKETLFRTGILVEQCPEMGVAPEPAFLGWQDSPALKDRLLEAVRGGRGGFLGPLSLATALADAAELFEETRRADFGTGQGQASTDHVLLVCAGDDNGTSAPAVPMSLGGGEPALLDAAGCAAELSALRVSLSVFPLSLRDERSDGFRVFLRGMHAWRERAQRTGNAALAADIAREAERYRALVRRNQVPAQLCASKLFKWGFAVVDAAAPKVPEAAVAPPAEEQKPVVKTQPGPAGPGPLPLRPGAPPR